MRTADSPRPFGGARKLLLALAVAVAGLAAAPAMAPSTAMAQEASAEAEPSHVTLRPGSSGPHVRTLQKALVEHGQDITVDGAYGPQTAGAVRAVEEELGLEPDGVADPELQEKLGIEPPPPPPEPEESPAACEGAGPYVKVFPLKGKNTYSNDFGAPRHQGRHEGIDLLADRGTPIVAVADGKVDRLTRTETGLGGLWVWASDRAGNEYYYAHMNSVARGLRPGSPLRAGQLLGTVGNTGDARYGSPHLHFEIHPGGGGAISGYSHLRKVDPAAGGCGGGGGPRPAAGDAAPAGGVTLSARQLRINQRISQAAVRRVNGLRERVTGWDAAPGNGASGRITLSARQLRINQRISQAAVRRVNSLHEKVTGEATGTGGGSEPGQVTLSARQLRINQRISQAAIRRVGKLAEKVEQAEKAQAAAG